MSSSPGYAKRYDLDRAQGIDRSPVPVEPIRAHLQRLLDAGVTPSAIGRACGVSRTGIRDIAQGRTSTVRRRLAARILRVTVEGVVKAADWPMAEVPARGSIRRVRALLALGHTHATITSAAGCRASARLTWSNPPRSVTKEVADGIDQAFRALCMTPGKSVHTRRRALAAGYVPPLGWDDIDNDPEPNTAPVGTVTVVEEAEWLARTGEDFDTAATRLGYRPATLERLLARNGRYDLVTTMRGAA